jgi:hypothetical protein
MKTEGLSTGRAIVKKVRVFSSLFYGNGKYKVDEVSLNIDSEDHKNISVRLTRKEGRKLAKELNRLFDLKKFNPRSEKKNN